MNILITGAAGFIGFTLSKSLLDLGHVVVGIDNINNYYDITLKLARLEILKKNENFKFYKCDIANKNELETVFNNYKFERVVNLAAQAGVRYSLENPQAYAESNLVGFLNILEVCRNYKIAHLVYASSSSVYGLNSKVPFKTSDDVDHPVSLYAATKKSNELMAHAYSYLFGIPTTGLRFFTVYGPWGRPDMALFKFTKAILKGEEIEIFNNGELSRDFTYIDDIVNGILKIIDLIPEKNPKWIQSDVSDPANSSAPFKVYNIGNGTPVKLLDFVNALETSLGIQAKKKFLPMQPGDVYKTWCDTSELKSIINYSPTINIYQGVDNFVHWYKSFNNIG
jgi:UDP-glucuronate 4-epimerase